MPVIFSIGETWDVEHEVVIFQAQKNQIRIRCAISRVALEDHFDANNVNRLDVFRANREKIEEKAEQIINSKRFEPDGSILIRTADL